MVTARQAHRTFRKPSTWPPLWSYGFAILITGIAVLLALIAGPLGPFTPALLFLAGVLTARVAGFVVSLVPIAIGTLAFRILLPSWIPAGQIGVFVLVSVISCAVTSSLRAAKIHLARILDSISDAFAVIDRSWRFQFVNRRAAELVRRGADQLVGRSMFEVFPELDRTSLLRTVDEARAGGKPVRVESHYAPLGIWFEATVVATREGVLVFARDITERKHDEERLHRSLEAISRSNRELERFAGLVSHDFTQPLGAITSYAELIRGEATGTAQRFAAQILQVAQRMAALLRLYLDYSRAGAQRPPLVPVPLEAVLERVRGDLGDLLRRSRVEIEHAPLPTVAADRELLELLFRHLLTDLAGAGRGAPMRLRFAAEPRGDEWVVSVVPSLSEPADPVDGDAPAGSGVRMAFCRRIVELHGGTLWTEAVAHGGTAVHLTLPSAPAAVPC